MWYNQCIVIKMSLNLSDVMHIVDRLTTGPSDIIAPVGITSSHHCSRRRNVICDVTAKLWVLNFWIKFATIRAKKCLKMLSLVSCDKQKMALMCFLSQISHSWVSRPRKPLVWYFHSKNTLMRFSYYIHQWHFIIMSMCMISFGGLLCGQLVKANSPLSIPGYSPLWQHLHWPITWYTVKFLHHLSEEEK
jgi:hypothetical protein